ncbi:hypothetical protein OAO01_01530, partial [Oligoflexia bacterium]|nr:hypothetical protein [Oligoflexia bacterium]
MSGPGSVPNPERHRIEIDETQLNGNRLPSEGYPPGLAELTFRKPSEVRGIFASRSSMTALEVSLAGAELSYGLMYDLKFEEARVALADMKNFADQCRVEQGLCIPHIVRKTLLAHLEMLQGRVLHERLNNGEYRSVNELFEEALGC